MSDYTSKNRSNQSDGTLSYLDAGGEQTVVELIGTTRRVIFGVWLDMTNLTENGVIKVYYKIDGTNYRLVTSASFTVATDDDGFLIDVNFPVNQDFKVTYTEDADEGAARDIPFSLQYEIL